MRFVVNFIVFGLIFFLLWRYVPDVFETLFTWVGAVWDTIVYYAQMFFEKISEGVQKKNGEKAAEGMLIPILYLAEKFRR